MDYGQNNQTDGTNVNFDFFTSGAGTNVENENTFDAEDNVDLTNPEISWGIQNSPRKIGNSAMQSSVEKIPSQPESPAHREEMPQAPSKERTPELGQIVPTMPPGDFAMAAEAQSATTSTATVDFARDKVMKGDTLNDDAVNALQDEERQLTSTGDIATFMEHINDYREQFQGRHAA